MSTLSVKDFSVGQELFFMTSRRHSEKTLEPVKVEKIGREWVTTSNGHRFKPPSMVADAGQYQPWGSFWTSKEAYEENGARIAAWAAFRKAVDPEYSVPAHLTTEQIRAMTAMVRGDAK